MSIDTYLNTPQGRLFLHETRANGRPQGTIICIHGGPNGDFHGNGNIFDEICSYSTAMGYDVVQFDMLGYGKSDGTPQQITLGSQVDNYRSVLEYVLKSNPKAIHIIGESMGATIAALYWSDVVETYILLWPAFDLKDTDFSTYFTAEWRSVVQEKGYLDDNGTIIGEEFYNEILSHDFSNCFRIPKCSALLVHGKKDDAVPFKQSLRAISEGIGPLTLYAHPTAGHGFQHADERAYVEAAIKKWLSHS